MIYDVFLKDCIVGDVVKWAKSDMLHEILSTRRVMDLFDDREEDDVQIVALNRHSRTVVQGTYHCDAKVALFRPADPPDTTASRIALEAIVALDGASTT